MEATSEILIGKVAEKKELQEWAICSSSLCKFELLNVTIGIERLKS
jgi:hypothetical protein